MLFRGSRCSMGLPNVTRYGSRSKCAARLHRNFCLLRNSPDDGTVVAEVGQEDSMRSRFALGRLSVEFLLELTASGATQVDILAAYPQLTADGLAAAFLYAAHALKHEQTIDVELPA